MQRSVYFPFWLVIGGGLLIFGLQFCGSKPNGGLVLQALIQEIDVGKEVSFFIDFPGEIDSISWLVDGEAEPTSGDTLQTGLVYPFLNAGNHQVIVQVFSSVNAYSDSVSVKVNQIIASIEPKIIAKPTAKVGEKISFRTNIEDANSYEWEFPDSRDVDKTGSSVSNYYDKAGTFTVTLYVEGGKKAIAKHTIAIQSKAKPKPYASCGVVSSAEFARWLNMTTPDKGTYRNFRKVFKDKGSTPVSCDIEGNKGIQNFNELFDAAKDSRFPDIASDKIKFKFDSDSCIIKIIIQR